MAPQWWEDYKEWVISGYEEIIRELSQEFMIDVSWSFQKVKIGISIVVNLEDQYLEFYPHSGFTKGFSTGLSVSFGVLVNYEIPGDYDGLFVYVEGGYFVGGGHCFSPFDYNHGASAYYIEIGSPNISGGVDYYFWGDWMVFDWSGK